MCGIAGYIGLRANETSTAKVVTKMCNALMHRGPDAQQIKNLNAVCFGHTRLSIIDLNPLANQPMSSNDGKLLLVLNGEIYNYQSLKAELSGYAYQTNSDTEVVLAAYEKWGNNFIYHLKGMFSIALYDSNTNQTILARDRFGKKPLYYFEKESQLWFSSEIRSLLASGEIKRKINKSVLGYYLQYQTVHFPDTMIEGVRQLAPGQMFILSNGEKQVVNYFKEETDSIPFTNYDKKTLQTLFYEAVEKRLISDVPLAVLLSAGIDSNLILAAASKIRKMDAFTIGFEQPEFDESVLAAQSAKHYQAKHHIIKLKEADYLSSVEASLQALDHPSGDGANTYLISHAIKNAGFTVALSGLGGDEIFYGYPHYALFEKLNQSKTFRAMPRAMFSLANGLIKNNKLSKLKSLREHIDSPVSSMASFRSNYDAKSLLEHFGLVYKAFALDSSSNNALNDISKTEVIHYMHDVLLRDADQMSMAHSLELRNPFLDQDLVKYVWSIKNKTSMPAKNLLLDAFKEDLPAYILNKKKTGFTFPWDIWMKGELRAFCEQQINFLEQTKIFKTNSVSAAWMQYLNGSKVFTWSRIWPLVSLAFWINKNDIDCS